MKREHTFGGMVTAAAFALLAGCSRPPPLPPAVALVGQDAIRVPEFKAELDRARSELRPRGDHVNEVITPSADELKVLRRTVLSDLIDRKLLVGEATRAGVQVTDREVDDALKARQQMAMDPEVLKDPVIQDQLRQRTKDELLIDRFLVREVAARVAVTPDEVKEYFETHPEEFQRPEQVRCAQILVPKREDAEALKMQLNRGTEFGKLAREQSASDDKAKGGDLGWFGHGQMPPEFEQACFSLKKGQVSDVVASPYGFHLFKLTDRREPIRQPLAEVEEAITTRLTREKVAKAEADYVEKLRREAGVQLVETEIDKVP